MFNLLTRKTVLQHWKTIPRVEITRNKEKNTSKCIEGDILFG